MCIINRFMVVVCCVAILFTPSCKKVAKVELPELKVQKNQTAYKIPLRKLGVLSREIETASKKFSVPGVRDDTGASAHSGGEIQDDITEMLKSALNQIGGKVRPVSYDPGYINNMAAVGASKMVQTVPDYIIEGGITEFDRSLMTSGSGISAGATGTVSGQDIGGDVNSQDKSSSSNITIDLNLVNGRNLTMMPRMNAINSIKVHKGISEFEIGIQILSASLGYSDSIKKIQGRHAAIRLLVELGILELVGKSMVLPYWKCLPEGQPDEQFLETLKEFYQYEWPIKEKHYQVQRLLKAYGFKQIKLTGTLTQADHDAVKLIAQAYNFTATAFNSNLFITLFVNVPVLGEKTKISSEAIESVSMNSVAAKTHEVKKDFYTPKKVVQQNKPLNIDLTASDKNVTNGNSIQLFFTGNKSFYGKVIVVTSAGQVVQLLPNDHRTKNYFVGSKMYHLPDNIQDKYALTVTPPFGKERFILYAAESDFSPIAMKQIGNGLRSFEGNLESFEGQLGANIKKEIIIQTGP